MQKEMKNQTAIDNFLCSLDISLPLGCHTRNAINDSLIYGWKKKTLNEILKGIEKAYKEKEK